MRGKQGDQGVLDEVATHSSVVHSTGGRPSVLTFLDFAVGVKISILCALVNGRTKLMPLQQQQTYTY